MASFTKFVLSCLGIQTKRATPALITNIVARPSPASIHDRRSFTAPALKSAKAAAESRLFKEHPKSYVSFSELIPGLAPVGEVQLQDLEWIQAEGTISNVGSYRTELVDRLTKIHRENKPTVGSLRAEIDAVYASIPIECRKNLLHPAQRQIDVLLEKLMAEIEKVERDWQAWPPVVEEKVIYTRSPRRSVPSSRPRPSLRS
ncbi:uncharacterized protein JCM15063_005771 [Sporobolomyces koalae]|uniref:uncharacterized protein n=1 Tax=Sporobolomyces koalae TaxID=500713 RepID=UPI003180AF40